ncbi:hypothetical protein M9Q43_14145, partial [Flavobacterium sp. HXWNR29]|uniref:hypothetical protein n=1 Tax=Flavobacterium odoriferum TaxID=2946604 RepID=UPI0021CB5102
RTSLVDDLEFYEGREKSLLVKRGSKPGELYANGNLSKQQVEQEAKGAEEVSKNQGSSVSTLVNLTNKMSLNSDPKVAL